jgi:iron complex outermembrane receptor protein
MRKLNSASRLRRGAALGALLSATGGLAFAQETTTTVDTVQPPEAVEEESSETITITGSRIQQDTYNSPSAMTVVTTDEADVQGVVDIATLLQNSVAAAGSSQVTAALSTFLANPQGGIGAQTLSLRGLGAQRTLVLLNGRRAGPAGTGGSIGPFDLNVIPLSAVSRVEILKDGASSLYGSDAIAGVVNIITRTDSGSSFDVSYTYPEMGAAQELSVSGTWGHEFDNGYVRVSADYFKQEEFDRGDRDFFNCSQLYGFRPDGSRVDLFDERRDDYTCVADVIWGHNWTYDYGPNAAASAPGSGGFRHRPWQTTAGRYQYDYSGTLGGYLQAFSPVPGNPTSAPSGIINPAGWYPVGYQNIITAANQDPVWGPFARNSGAYQDFYHPLQDETTLSPSMERMSIVAAGEYDLTDSLKVYGEVLLNRRTTVDDSYTQIYTFQYQYRAGPGGDLLGDPIAEQAGWSLYDDDFYYVFHSPTAITDWNDTTVQVDYFRAVAGLSGDIGFPMPGWTFDLSAQFSRSSGSYKEQIAWVDAITDQEMRTSLCAGTTTRYRGVPCVDINWYAPDLNYGILTPQEQAFLHGTTYSTTTYEQTTIEGYITGALAPLPAGDLNAVFGFLYQDDAMRDRPDQAWLDGEVWRGGPTRRGITEGNDDTRAAYFEFQVPLIKDLPLMRDIELSLSGRYTDVASYGGDSTWKAGLSWAVTDEIRFRGAQGTSFRAPGLYELYLAEQVSRFAQAGDPCAQWGPKLAAQQITQRMADNCARDPKFPGGIGPTQLSTGGIQATVYTSGGYGTLRAETSESRSLGVVFSPEALGDFQLSID